MRLAALPAARRSRVLRLLPAAAVLLAALLPGAAPAPRVGPAAGDRDAVASYYRPEVRLRKLHLVRPDLIPYPLSYDVYC